MSYKLFLDDERFPADYDEDWVIARNFADAVWYVEARGAPDFISFDHDLGTPKEGHFEKSGYDFAKWFCDYANDEDNGGLPYNFSYMVHSMNPIGAENIKQYMQSFLKHYAKTRG